MGFRQRQILDAPSRACYERLRQRLLLGRLRLAASIGIFFLAADFAFRVAVPDYPGRLPRIVATMAICCLWLTFARSRHLSRYPRVLAVTFVLAMGSAVFFLIDLAPQDLDVLTAPISCVMIGSTLVLPWGPLAQASVSGLLGVGYMAVLGPEASAHGLRAANIAMSLTVSAGLSVVGAAVLEQSRRYAFAERRRVRALAVQRRHLIDIGRDLQSGLDLATVVSRLVEHAARLVPADGVVVALRDSDAGVYRNAGARGSSVFENLNGLTWQEAFTSRFDALLGRRGVTECPGGAADDLVLPMISPLGVGRALITRIGSSVAPVGLIAWLRTGRTSFAQGQRLAAQGIADQAFTALCAARLHEETARVSALRSEFISTVSHELRTPLNVILGFTEMARDGGFDKEQRIRFLDRIEAAGRHLLELIEDTLVLGRLEAGREVVQLEPVSLEAFWAQLRETCDPLPRSAEVVLAWEEQIPRLTLVTDPGKLGVVMRNLIVNALKFTERGYVRVGAGLREGRVELWVADTGIGIRPEHREAIFELFRQADSSTSRRFGGTGLGLYIVRQFVAQVGGRVTVDSTPGRGSVFTVSLPLAAAKRPVRPAPEHPV